MSLVKYRIKEVAADFGVAPKEISAIVEKYFEKPKSTAQVLEENQLNVIFDLMTQRNQISSVEVVFAAAFAAEEKRRAEEEKRKAEEAAKKAEEEKKRAEEAKAAGKPAPAPAPAADRRPGEKKPAQGGQNTPPRSPPSPSASGSAGWWTPPPSRSTPTALTTGWTP
jgi:hypothetical protein